MRRLLVVGDSLAGGPTHLCYPRLAARRLSGWWVRAVALPGKTVRKLGEELAATLPLYQPDVLVLQGGGNDLLIPYLKARGGRWSLLARLLLRGGNRPASGEREFGELLRKALSLAVKTNPGSAVILSVPCLGEDPRTPLNQRRRLYNAVMEEVADELGVRLVRIDLAMEEAISGCGEVSPYLMDEFSGFFLDALRSLTPRGALRLSERRGLHLTLDGVHPNPRGAELLAELLLEALGRAE